MKLWVGTSGYSYKEWLGTFYPEDLPAKEMLHYYAGKLNSVEINNTFYRFPKESVLSSWDQQATPEFRFAIKAPRKITHLKRLKDIAQEVEDFLRVTAALKSHLGPLLFQLPPNLKKDMARLADFLAQVPSNAKIALEFRNASWFDDEVYAALKAHNIALCISDNDDDPNPKLISTANFGYLRMRCSRYTPANLITWKEWIEKQRWEHAYVYFKHEDGALGPKLAAEFGQLFAPR